MLALYGDGNHRAPASQEMLKIPGRQSETQEVNLLISGASTWQSVARRATEALRVKSAMQQCDLH